MIVTITGGRDYHPDSSELVAMAAILRERSTTVVRTGGARGVDALVYDYLRPPYWTDLDFLEIWMPDWSRHHNAAGPMRNRAMLTGNANVGSGVFLARSKIFTAGRPSSLLIAFPGGVGTMRCCESAHDLSIPIEYIRRRRTS